MRNLDRLKAIVELAHLEELPLQVFCLDVADDKSVKKNNR